MEALKEAPKCNNCGSLNYRQHCDSRTCPWIACNACHAVSDDNGNYIKAG